MALFLSCRLLRNVKLKSDLAALRKIHHKSIFIVEKSFKPHFFQNKRNFYNYILKGTTPAQQKISDDVPDEYVLIYKSTLHKYITVAQVITSLCAGLIFIQLLYKEDVKVTVETTGGIKNMFARKTKLENEKLIYNTVFVLLMLALYVTISRLPLRIYYLQQQQRYIFISNGFIPFTLKKMTCKIGDVKPSPTQLMGFVPWGEHRYAIFDKKVYLMEENFRRPADLNIMLGLQSDKPTKM